VTVTDPSALRRSSPTLTLEVDDAGVAVVHMHDVAGKNAFSRAFVAELVQVFGELAHPTVKVAVLRGLDDVFSAGGDREVLMALATGDVAPYDLLLTRSLLEIPVPTIAAMAGHAVGGGLVFGLSADLVFMGRQSRYGLNFMEMGFTPGMGTTRLVQAAFGEYLAAEMMFGCQYFKGAQLEGRVLVNGVLDRAEVLPRAMDVAARMAEKPRHALELLKRTLGLPRRKAFEEARTLESLMHEICFTRPETRARIAADYVAFARAAERGAEPRPEADGGANDTAHAGDAGEQ
jgi:polyketide biosynthesis enoyl-CoA hydratase PksI